MSIFVPSEELKFDQNGKLKVFECTDKLRKLGRVRYYPLPAVALFGYYFVKSAFAFKIVQSLLWSVPLTIAIGTTSNLKDNAKTMV